MNNLCKTVLFSLFIMFNGCAYGQRGKASAEVVGCVRDMMSDIGNASSIVEKRQFSNDDLRRQLVCFAKSLEYYYQYKSITRTSFEDFIIQIYFSEETSKLVMLALENILFPDYDASL